MYMYNVYRSYKSSSSLSTISIVKKVLNKYLLERPIPLKLPVSLSPQHYVVFGSINLYWDTSRILVNLMVVEFLSVPKSENCIDRTFLFAALSRIHLPYFNGSVLD